MVDTGILKIVTTGVMMRMAARELGILSLIFGRTRRITMDAAPTSTAAGRNVDAAPKRTGIFSRNFTGTVSIWRPKKPLI